MEVIKKKKKNKFKWNKYKTVMLICFIIFVYGFFTVSNSLPKFVKDKASFSIYFSRKPFDFKIKSKNYTFYINYKVLDNIKKTNNTIMVKVANISNDVKDFFVIIYEDINKHIIDIKGKFSNMFIIINVKS